MFVIKHFVCESWFVISVISHFSQLSSEVSQCCYACSRHPVFSLRNFAGCAVYKSSALGLVPVLCYCCARTAFTLTAPLSVRVCHGGSHLGKRSHLKCPKLPSVPGTPVVDCTPDSRKNRGEAGCAVKGRDHGSAEYELSMRFRADPGAFFWCMSGNEPTILHLLGTEPRACTRILSWKCAISILHSWDSKPLSLISFFRDLQGGMRAPALLHRD